MNHLDNPDFRFILVKEHDKRPIENYWQCTTLREAQEKWEAEKIECERSNRKFDKKKPERITQYTFNEPELIEHKNKGGNYGVVCGVGGIIVVDVDKNMEDVEMPETLTIQTPSNGCHYYFICDELKKKIILERDGIHYGEIQAGSNTQIICPGCKAKSKLGDGLKEYKIIKDNPIKKITFEELKDLLGLYFRRKRQTNGRQIYVDDKFNLPIDRVINIGKLRQRGSEYQGSHPVHGSGGGNNFSVNINKNLWHCFRHDCGGGPLEMVGQIEGIISCGEQLKGDKFNLVLRLAREKYGMIQKSPSSTSDLKITVLQLMAQGKEDEATEMIVSDILGKNHIYTVRDDKAPETWIYHDGVYTPHGKTYILEECRQVLGNAYNIKLANMVVNKIMTDTFVEAEKFFNAENGDWVCVKNGLLNPIKKELREFTPEEIYFTKLPVEYNPKALCPNIIEHFKEVTNHESDLKVLEEVTGWFLMNEYKPERAIMLSGTGRNGKGKTIMLWKEFLGVENIATIALHQFEQDQYAAGDLLNKRANLAGDLDATVLRNTALFKQVTGRDPISSNRKYLSRIKFNNNAKMVCAANEIPRTQDLSVGFFSRWIIIDFPYRFVSSKEFEMADEDKDIMKIADLDIINKLATPDELSGLLNLGIEGLHRLIKNGDFSTSMTTEQVKREWVKRSDSFGAFAEEYIKEEYDSYLTKKEVRNEYSSYCKINKIRVSSDSVIKKKMSEMFGAFEARKSIDLDIDKQERVMVWEGVSWKAEKHVPMARVSRVSGGFPKVPTRARDTFQKCLDTLDTLDSNKLKHSIIDNLKEPLDNIELSILLGIKEEDNSLFAKVLEELKQIGYVYQMPDGKWRSVE